MVVSKEEGPVNKGAFEELSADHLYRVTSLTQSASSKVQFPNGQTKGDMADSEKAQPPTEHADFESAILATGYGRFNVLLMARLMPAFLTTIFVSSSLAFVFPKAKCDLDLSLQDMGVINAMIYCGMIVSAMLWGFLSDTLGRKMIMVYGLLVTAAVEVLVAFSQNFYSLIVLKFITGAVFNGPFVIMVTYMSELHASHVRAKVMVYASLFYTLGNTTLPLMAWAILPHDINLVIIRSVLVLRSWNVFLLVLALFPLISALLILPLPESPKFLMSRGRSEEALAILRQIYHSNTRKPEHTYPVQRLMAEINAIETRGLAALKDGFRQFAPLFRPPYALWLLLLCIIYTGSTLGGNTFRLWYPQMSAMLEQHAAQPGAGAASLCAVLESGTTNDHQLHVQLEECVEGEVGISTYMSSMLIGLGSLVSYGLGGALITRAGGARLAGACLLAGAAAAAAVPALPPGAVPLVSVIALAVAVVSLAGAALSSVVVDLFPTSLRVMAMAIVMMCGRVGTISGNVAFPALLSLGCQIPFHTIAFICAVCFLGCFLLPKTAMKEMQ